MDDAKHARPSARDHPSFRVERTEIATFVGALFRYAEPGTSVALRAFDQFNRGSKPTLLESARVGEVTCGIVGAAVAAAQRVEDGRIVSVFAPPICTFNHEWRARSEDLANGLVLSVEVDERPAEARSVLEPLLGLATVVVESGSHWTDPATGEQQPKVHLHWRLSEPTKSEGEHLDLHYARQLAQHLAGADPTGTPIVHPLRWPGTWNRKSTPKLARITSLNADAEIHLVDALDRLADAAGVTPNPSQPHSTEQAAGDLGDVASAMRALPNNDEHYDTWVKLGYAVWRATGGSKAGYDVWSSWSQRSGKFDADEQQQVWSRIGNALRGSNPSRRISERTIYWLARRHGWLGPSCDDNDVARPNIARLGDAPSDPAEKERSAGALRSVLSIQTWACRDLPPPNRLLGDLVTTTSRVFIVGRTGLGKTMFGLAMACGMASGRGFLHWRSAGPARVLLIDGEMPGELIRARAVDAIRRTGAVDLLDNLLVYSSELQDAVAAVAPTLGELQPLNTEAGHNFILALVEVVGGVDVVIFDNVMSLLTGDQKDEIPWSDTQPLIAQLTRKRIGQIWLDHTGHNSDRQYGSSTKAWRFDAVGIMTPLDAGDVARGEVAFTLSFEHPGKARRRTPENWSDFEPRVVRLRDDKWTSEPTAVQTEPAGNFGRLTRARLPYYDALTAAVGRSSMMGETTIGAWEAECLHRGLIEAAPTGQEKGKQRAARHARFRKAKSDLLEARWVAVEGQRVLDLKARWA